MNPGQKRMFYLDVARVIAIIAITLNHAVNRTYHTDIGQLAEYLSLPVASTLLKVAVCVFSRMGVPLFLMITGVLIMNKKMKTASDVRWFYKHNILSLFITTEIWYVLMYWFLVLGNNVIAEHGWPSVIGGMFSTMLFLNQTTMSSMWYMPMILCVYMTLPFVVMVKDKLEGSKDKLLYLPLVVLFVVAMVLPNINKALVILQMRELTSPIHENYLFSFYYVYIIVGYLIGKGVLHSWKNGTVVLCAVGSFLICCGYQFWVYTTPADYMITYDFPLFPVCTAFAFELIRRVAHWFQKAERPITGISRISFAIYFMHMLFVTALRAVLDQFAPGMMLPIRLILLEVIPVGLSIALILPLSKIKLLRKYLFLIK